MWGGVRIDTGKIKQPRKRRKYDRVLGGFATKLGIEAPPWFLKKVRWTLGWGKILR